MILTHAATKGEMKIEKQTPKPHQTRKTQNWETDFFLLYLKS